MMPHIWRVPDEQKPDIPAGEQWLYTAVTMLLKDVATLKQENADMKRKLKNLELMVD